MPMRVRAWVFVLLGAALVFVMARYWSSDERAVENVIRKLVEGAHVERGEWPPVRAARLASLFEETTTETLGVQSVDLPPAPAGREALQTWAQALDQVDDASFALVDLRIVIEGRRAAATSDVTFKAHLGGDEMTDRRAVAWRLTKGDHGWRVQSIDIGARPNDWPEARP